VKLGAPGDVENLKRIRAGYKGKLQVDANTAWNAAEAVRVLKQIEPLGIELVEQPVPRGDLDGLQWVRERARSRCSPTRARTRSPTSARSRAASTAST
jgi:L-alanine-DL-glutamate epimerase-like enolase superfamily enzyme